MNMRVKAVLLLAGVVCLGCTVKANGDFSAHRNIAYAAIPGVNSNLLSLDLYAPNPHRASLRRS